MVPARGTSQEAAPGPAPELTALSLGEEVTSKNNPALGISSRYSGLRDVAAVMDGENGQRTGRTIPVKNRGGLGAAACDGKWEDIPHYSRPYELSSWCEFSSKIKPPSS